ncbi:hypothetical protein L4D09_27520, partial [Photobacterium makurazakiensis]|uniref:hypothetical protein n=1 Tax=Photobacterium makurazakiensis TaxID=2910234 RepID=UPI003D118CF2
YQDYNGGLMEYHIYFINELVPFSVIIIFVIFFMAIFVAIILERREDKFKRFIFFVNYYLKNAR